MFMFMYLRMQNTREATPHTYIYVVCSASSVLVLGVLTLQLSDQSKVFATWIQIYQLVDNHKGHHHTHHPSEVL